MIKSKIQTQFILNYIVLSLVVLSVCFAAFGVYRQYEDTELNSYTIDVMVLYDDYATLGLEHAMGQQKFIAHDFVLVLDMNYTVIDSSNDAIPRHYKYTKAEFYEMIYGQEFYNYYIYYAAETQQIVVLYTGYLPTNMSPLLVASLTCVLFFLILTFIVAKNSSNSIITPLNKLVVGVQQIAKGDYHYDFNFKSNNELDILKDEISYMSNELEKETNQRVELQRNRSQLLSSVSHDIKTPLTNIIGYSDKILNTNQFTSEDQKQSLEIIHQYALRAGLLLSDLTDLSDMTSELTTLNFQTTDMIEFLRLKFIEYVPEFEHRHIGYDFTLPNTPVPMTFDTIKIERVIDNIIGNALKYNPSKFTIDCAVYVHDAFIEIIISDDGIGIPSKFSEQVFEPLFRIETSRNPEYGGSGLGLSIVREIIKLHRGTIHLDKKISTGCRFVINLPIAT